MLEEHGKILMMLDEAEKDFRKFAIFRETLEEHFSIEETVIFSYYNEMVNGEISDFFELLKEHGTIVGLVRSIEKRPEKFGELKELLVNHLDLENNVFYPKFDKMLDENQRGFLIEKIRGLLRKE